MTHEQKQTLLNKSCNGNTMLLPVYSEEGYSNEDDYDDSDEKYEEKRESNER